MEGGGIGTQNSQNESDTVTTTKQLSRAIRYLANSDACIRVQFRRDPEMCDRHAVDGCVACWDEELGRESPSVTRGDDFG